MATVVNDGFGGLHIFLIKLKERRPVQDREKWRPFLEEDANHLVRIESWRGFPCDWFCQRVACLDMKASRQELFCIYF